MFDNLKIEYRFEERWLWIIVRGIKLVIFYLELIFVIFWFFGREKLFIVLF